MAKTNLTEKQADILNQISIGGIDDYDEKCRIDLDQLINSVSYSTTKESMQFSVRALISLGYIAKANRVTRRNRSRITYVLSSLGRGKLEEHQKKEDERSVAASSIAEDYSLRIGSIEDDIALELGKVSYEDNFL